MSAESLKDEQQADTVVIRSAQDIIDYAESGRGRRRNPLLIIVIALGGIFIDAYDFTTLGLGAAQLQDDLGIGAFEIGLISGTMAVGALFGATVGGYYVDKVGRKKMFELDLIFFVVAALGCAFAPNFWVLWFFRLLMGIGIGLDFPAAMSYIAEFSNPKTRHRFVSMWQVWWFGAVALGFLLILPFYYAGTGVHLWRWAVGFSAVPAILVLVARYRYMGESPLWAARNLPLDQAAKVLEDVYHVEVDLRPDPNAPPLPAPSSRSGLDHVRRLFNKRFRARTALVGLTSLTQALEYYAIGFYLPSIALVLWGDDFLNSILGSIGFNLIGLVAALAQVMLIGKFGCRGLALFGYVITTAVLLILGFAYDAFGIVAASTLLVVFLIGHVVGQGGVGMTMGTLSYPTDMRGLGTGWSQFGTRIGSIVGLTIFPAMLDSIGLANTFLVLSVAAATGLIANALIRWEPIGKDVEGTTTPAP